MAGERVTLRAATPKDVPAISALVEASVRGLAPGYYSPEQIERSIERVFGVDTQLVGDGTYFVAEAAGEIVGCGGWSARTTLYGGDQTKAGVEDARLDPARDAARVRAFFVHPSWARRGIGSRILARCEEAAREAGFATATLVATLPGEPLYAALGYVRGDAIDVDLGDGETLRCYAMTKRLD
jgi:N-acetylglutamate synthase-like GNAT family acetyltransferase